MHPRAAELMHTLELERHPEGGAFREVYRASRVVATPAGARPAATHIYFLLVSGDHSRWHRVPRDEMWHLYEGDSLELLLAPPDWNEIVHREVGGVRADREPATLVPAGWWQTARTLGEFSLAGCTVAPGFEFADFALLGDDADARAALTRRFPDLARYIDPARP